MRMSPIGFRQKTSPPRDSDQSVLPLINVVFLLLIFFMLAGQLAASDPFVIEPPKSQSEAQNAPEDMMIQISADGRFALDGIEMSKEEVIEAARRRLISAPDTAPPALRLKADGRTEAREIVNLMQDLRQAGFEKLKLLTLPRA